MFKINIKKQQQRSKAILVVKDWEKRLSQREMLIDVFFDCIMAHTCLATRINNSSLKF